MASARAPARPPGQGRAHVGPGGAEGGPVRAGASPPRQSAARSQSRAQDAEREPCGAAGKWLSGERRPLPSPAQGQLLGNSAGDPGVSGQGQGRPVCLKPGAPDVGISDLGCEKFSSLENSSCVLLKRTCPFSAFADHNEEPRQKEWACQTLHPEEQPGATGSRSRGSPGTAQTDSSCCGS